ncbi:PRC-barrel domain-containing protein [Paractinoplanes atraurantiacus]|uniref:Sporulation protein YlmC, PRC-barrel domain family n=1 Tax=Paractinoplanes atraurantiacus TaxID=1036182 RepID=A0A285GPW2_9ACTN|nr:PRC-barrel domain-containing protein [Actinoplanes atraurantiacus]SNY25577.1 Sporulation protein YlmC, PRC-barrel domain family [Actinoplanes atraurantiacus]
MNTESGTMMGLHDSGQMLADPGQDIRGRKVQDRDGNDVGKVDDLLVDTEHQKVRLLRVEHGGLFGIGATPVFIPVEAVERVTDDEVGIDRSRIQVADAPPYDPELVDRDEYFNKLYNYYGYAPYWSPGYIPPSRGFFR